MSRDIRALSPIENEVITWAGAANSQAVRFSVKSTSGPLASDAVYPTNICIGNNTTVVMYVAWGTTAPTADTTGYAIMPGTKELIAIPETAAFVAVIPEATVTGKVYISRGLGV